MHELIELLTELIKNLGGTGVFVAMFLESSIVPVPSEVIIMGAGALGIAMPQVLLYGSIGATLGACVGYALGRYAAMPVILKFGKFILIKPHHIEKAESFARKYGAWSVFIGRLLPVVPFKVFSIAAGITKLPFVPFVVFTLAGVLPRIYVLVYFGTLIMQYKRPALLILCAAILVVVAIKISRSFYRNNKIEIKPNAVQSVMAEEEK